MTAQSEMLFDPVHDTQLLYRELLDAFAEPGKVKSAAWLAAGAAPDWTAHGAVAAAGGEKAMAAGGADPAGQDEGGLAHDAGAMPGGTATGAAAGAAPSGRTGAQGGRLLAALAMTLLDSEVSFAVRTDDAEPIAAYIRLHTFARPAEPGAADYIFADGRAQPAGWAEDVRRGTLTEPEHGATVFLQADELLEDDGGQTAPAGALRLTLSGPGVPGERTMFAAGLAKEWLELRRRWNAEYPLGADMVLFTASGKLAALPRTTKATE